MTDPDDDEDSEYQEQGAWPFVDGEMEEDELEYGR
jgi:hypothetical protein